MRYLLLILDSLMLYESLQINMLFSVKVCNIILFAGATGSEKDLDDMQPKDGSGATSDSQSPGMISNVCSKLIPPETAKMRETI